MPTTNCAQKEIKTGKPRDHAETNPCHLMLLSNYSYTHSSVPIKVLGKRQRPLKLKMRPLPLRNIDKEHVCSVLLWGCVRATRSLHDEVPGI